VEQIIPPFGAIGCVPYTYINSRLIEAITRGAVRHLHNIPLGTVGSLIQDTPSLHYSLLILDKTTFIMPNKSFV
jgi:hypothetical protein